MGEQPGERPPPGRPYAAGVPGHVLVLQHAPWERAGLIGRALGDLPVATRTVLDDPAPQLPPVGELAGLVVMGGPMGADDDAAHPGLPAERRLLAAAVDAQVPVLGVCLGMQLLARALGATVHPGHGTEIGVAPVEVLGPDPVLDPLGAHPDVLHWHSDAVDLPAGATLLARSPVTPVQAFRAGSALGLQFHIEVDAGLWADWLAERAVRADLARHGVDVARLRADAHAALPDLARAARAGLGAFAAQVRARV